MSGAPAGNGPTGWHQKGDPAMTNPTIARLVAARLAEPAANRLAFCLANPA